MQFIQLRRVSSRLADLATLLLLWTTIGCSDPGYDFRPNIVLILVDTLRADHLGCYGYQRPTSPSIDGIANEGVRFENAFSTASYTRAATASLFTGHYPSVHGAISYKDAITDGVPTLARLLGDTGYQTVGYYLNGNVSSIFGFNRGFEQYEHPGKEFRKKQRLDPKGRTWTVGDDAITWKVLPFLRQVRQDPFFLYLHFSGPHAPYAPPPEATSFIREPLTATAQLFYQKPEIGPDGKPRGFIGKMQLGQILIDELTKRQMVDLYDGEVAFTDQQVGLVMQALRENGLHDSTIVMVTADHGEEFWEHGGVAHGHSHYQELLRIPLLVIGPGIRARAVSTPISLIDVMPTILEFAGLEPSSNLPGRSLARILRSSWKEPAARSIYAEGLLRFDGSGVPIGYFRSLQDGNRKLVIDGRKRWKFVFDLEKDPGEQNNLLLGPRQDEGRKLLEKLFEIHNQNLHSSNLGSSRRAEITPELEANLGALGYLGDESESDLNSIFRRPFRHLDWLPYGLIGYERNLSQYRSAFDFTEDGFTSTEQLIYGWKNVSEQGIVMTHMAGIQLKRGVNHSEWRIKGSIPRALKLSPNVELDILIEGTERHRRTIHRTGLFEISLPLPARQSSVSRLDMTCSGGPLFSGHGTLNENAPCVFVSSVRLQ